MQKPDENFMVTPLIERHLLTYNNSNKPVVDDLGRKTEILGKPILEIESASRCPRVNELVLTIRNKTIELHNKKHVDTSLRCPVYFYDRPFDELVCLFQKQGRGLVEANIRGCPFGGAYTRFNADWVARQTKGRDAMSQLPVSVSIRNPQQTRHDSSDPRECGIEI